MKYLVVLLAAMLAGCTYDLKLFQRGSKEIALGTLYPGPSSMEVILRGEKYTGVPVRGQSFGFGSTVGTVGAKQAYGTSTSVSASNAFTVLMLSPSNKTLRCEFSGQVSGGNGICVDGDNAVYDLMITRQE